MHPDCRAAVVVPCKNEAKLLPHTLKSLLNAHQSLPNPNLIEIIFVDGSSTDTSSLLLSQFARLLPQLKFLNLSKPGIGHARQYGSTYALNRADQRSNQANSHFWLISTDADTLVPENWLTNWLSTFDTTTEQVLVGYKRFSHHIHRCYPYSTQVFSKLDTIKQHIESIFGVINFTGTNSAIERSAYLHAGPFLQPQTKLNNQTVLLAGEDWDLGTRARSLGYQLRRVNNTVITSARRFTTSPTNYFSGQAYSQAFSRVNGASGQDITPNIVSTTINRYLAHLSTHFIDKPLIIDNSLSFNQSVTDFLGSSLTQTIQTWLSQHTPPNLFHHRNQFMLNYLPQFHHHFQSAITNRIISL